MNVWKWCLVWLLCFSGLAQAGSREGQVNEQIDPQKLVEFAKQVERTAAAKGARVFLLARVGRASEDLPEGINYTHTGIAVYSMITTADGKQMPGYAIYNLYQDSNDLSRSKLVMDFPVDFFAGAFELKAGIAIPSVAVQKRLLQLITSGDYKKLHNPQYSVLANPFDNRYQNCTEFTLDLINSAIYNSTDKAQLKANSKAWFKPQKIAAGRLKLRLADMVMDDLTLKDHGKTVQTATFTSIVHYLEQNGLLKHHQQLQ